jgi:hypothetical protein
MDESLKGLSFLISFVHNKHSRYALSNRNDSIKGPYKQTGMCRLEKMGEAGGAKEIFAC